MNNKNIYLWPNSSIMSRYFDEYYFELKAQNKVNIKELDSILPIPKHFFKKLINYKFFRKYILGKILNKENHLIHFTSQLNIFHDITENFIFTFHDVLYLNTGLSGTYYSNQMSDNIKKSVNKAKKIITISNNSKQKILLYYKCEAEKITVIPNGINIQNDFNLIKRNNSVLFVGSNAPRKNIINVLEAVKYYQNNYDKSLKLIIISQLGNFGQLNTYNRIIDHLKINNLEILESIDIEKLNILYKSEGVLVYPTLDEGFGLPPIEAQSFGMPVIASDIPIMKEILNNSVMYCNPNSYVDIAEKIFSILKIQENNEFFKKSGYQNHLKFGIKNSVQLTCDLYEKLLNV